MPTIKQSTNLSARISGTQRGRWRTMTTRSALEDDMAGTHVSVSVYGNGVPAKGIHRYGGHSPDL